MINHKEFLSNTVSSSCIKINHNINLRHKILIFVFGCSFLMLIGDFPMEFRIRTPTDIAMSIESLSLSQIRDKEGYQSSSSGSREEQQVLRDRPRDNTSATNGGAKFVFVVGVEGTGHHFMQQQILMKSPSYRQLQHWRLLPNAIEAQDELIQIWINQCERASHSNKHEDKDHDHFVQILDNINRQIMHHQQQQKNRKLSYSQAPQATTTVMLNLLDKMVSYPMGGYCHRSDQYFTLDTLYHACAKAHVQCGHVIMWRDPYEVIYSGTKHRHFSTTVKRQILDLTKMLDVILKQMDAYPMNLEACIDFNIIPRYKPQQIDAVATITSTIPLWGELFGWEEQQHQNNSRDSSMISFQQMMSDMWHPSQRKFKVDYTNMISKRNEEVMKVFVEKMNHVAALCTEQLQQQQERL